MPKWFLFQPCLSTLVALPLVNGSLAAEPFYQGKTLRVIVASAAGGGSDIVARLMMRHLPRHIPGNPPIVIGGSGYGSIKDVSMLAAMNLLGVKNPTYVTGYGGAGPIRLAYERAEVNFTQETAVGISRSVVP